MKKKKEIWIFHHFFISQQWLRGFFPFFTWYPLYGEQKLFIWHHRAKFARKFELWFSICTNCVACSPSWLSWATWQKIICLDLSLSQQYGFFWSLVTVYSLYKMQVDDEKDNSPPEGCWIIKIQSSFSTDLSCSKFMDSTPGWICFSFSQSIAMLAKSSCKKRIIVISWKLWLNGCLKLECNTLCAHALLCVCCVLLYYVCEREGGLHS